MSTPEAAGRVSVGAEDLVCFWIVEKLFVLAKVSNEFPRVCAKIGFCFNFILASYLHESWAADRYALTYGLMLHSKICNSHSDQIFTHKKRKYEHTWRRGTSHYGLAQCISACGSGAVLNVNIIYVLMQKSPYFYHSFQFCTSENIWVSIGSTCTVSKAAAIAKWCLY